MTGRLKFFGLIAVAALVATACNYVYAPFLVRVDGPVVVTAADLGVENLNLDPTRGLGYRWDEEQQDFITRCVRHKTEPAPGEMQFSRTIVNRVLKKKQGIFLRF